MKLEAKRVNDAKEKIKEMRESLKQRKEKLGKSKDLMNKKEVETNKKYKKYREAKSKIRILLKYHYNEALRLMGINNTSSFKGYFEFRDDETPKQLEEFVVIPIKKEKSENLPCGYVNVDFENYPLEYDKKQGSRVNNKKKGQNPNTGEEEYMSTYKEYEITKINESEDYKTKILTFYDDETRSKLHLKETLTEESFSYLVDLSQRITETLLFLLTISCITNIPLLYSININQDGYCVRGQRNAYRLSLYLPPNLNNKEVKSAFNRDIESFEHGICLLNKDLIHLSYVLGCPVPKFQDDSILPIEWLYKYREQIIGEPVPVDKINKEGKVFKNIDAYLLKSTKREIQKFVVQNYFSAEHFPLLNN